MALPFSANFNTDQNPLSGSFSTLTPLAPLMTSGGLLRATAAGGAGSYYIDDTFADGEIELQVVTGSANAIDLLLRFDPVTLSGYMLDITPTSWGFYKVVNGSATVIGADQSKTIANGTIVKFRLSGSTLTAYFNGVADSYTRTDTTFTTTGNAGMILGDTTVAGDNLTISALPGAALTGSAVATSGAAGALTTAIRLVGAAIATTVAAATLSLAGAALAGSAGAVSGAGGTLTTGISLTGAASATTGTNAILDTGPWPLAISGSGRYLVDRSGAPFRLNCESAWLLPSWATAADVDSYLASRAAKGFTAFVIMAPTPNLTTLAGVPNQPTTPPLTVAGLNPFTGAVGDFRSVYAEAYWQWIDTIVDKAAAAGLAVVIAPAYLEAQGGPQGTTVSGSWAKDIYDQAAPTSGNSAVNTQTVMYAYGQWLGSRYRHRPNVLWLAAGDYVYADGSEGNLRAHKIIEGIRDSWPTSLTLFQGNYYDSIPDDYADWSDMDLRSFYGYGPGGNEETFSTADRAWIASPTRPVMMIEPHYAEAGDATTRTRARREIWHAVTAGCTAGENSAVAMYSEGVGYPGWATGIEDAFAYDRAALFSLFGGLRWYEMLPSGSGGGRLGQTLITAGVGSGLATVTSCATADGAALIAYIPPTGTGQTSITVDLTALADTARARWYDPTDGTYQTIGSYPTSGSQAFVSPGTNAAGTNDWALVLDVVAATPLDGAVLATSGAIGELTTAITLTGAGGATSAAGGDLSTSIPLLGLAPATTASAAELTTGIPLAGSAVADSFASGILNGGALLTGEALAISGAGGELLTAIPLRGTAVASTDASGDLTSRVTELIGVAMATSGATGELTTAIPLIGSALATGYANGLLAGSYSGPVMHSNLFPPRVCSNLFPVRPWTDIVRLN